MIDPLTLAFVAGGAGLLAFGRMWTRVLRSRRVVALLYDDRPQDFLDEIERDIEACAHDDVFRWCLLVNKSAGLYYVGRFEDALALLRSIPIHRLPRTFQTVYVHNLLTSLLELRLFEEARQVMEEHGRLLVPETKVKALNEAIRGSLALFELNCGDRRAGYRALEELSKHLTTDAGRAFRLYHLGVADLEDGQPERASHSLRMAVTLAPNSFVPKRVAALLP